MNHRNGWKEILNKAKKRLQCRGIIMGLEVDGDLNFGSAGEYTEQDTQGQFYIYSLTKTFTAALLLKLQEKKNIDLDQPIHDFVAQSGIPEAITVRQLLNNTSGIPDYRNLSEYQTKIHETTATPWSKTEFLEKIADSISANGLRFPPGEGWEYSNTNYLLLYLLMEKITKISFKEAMHELLLDPLCLHNTTAYSSDYDRTRLLPGYKIDVHSDDIDIRTYYHPDWCATGLLISTLHDVIKFYQCLFEGKIINRESLLEMKDSVRVTNKNCKPFISAKYGLGIMHDPLHPLGECFGHGGGGPGYSIFANHTPDSKGKSVTFCVMCNSALPATPFFIWLQVLKAFHQS